MATLVINGKRVKVDDSFATLSPADQQRTVEEIAAKMAGPSAAPQQQAMPAVPAAAAGATPPPNPQASVLPGPMAGFQDFTNATRAGFDQGMTLGFGDEIYAGATAPFRALPGLFNGEGYDIGKAYEAGLDTTRQTTRDQRALNPAASTVGEVTGAVLNPASRLFMPVKGGSAAMNLLRGAGGGAAVGGAYGVGSAEGDLGDRARGGMIGAGIGAALGLVAPWLAKKGGDAIEGVLQNRATSAAIKAAPSAAELKASSQQMFQAVDKAGVTVDTNKFSGLVQQLVAQAKKDRINPNLDPKATAAYQEMIAALDDVQKNGAALTISDMHTLRQIAQKAAMSAEGRDAMFANRIVDGIDNFVTSPGNTVLPKNQIGGGSAAGGNELLQAISTWGRARRVGMIEEATYKAQNAASGFENGLRTEFRKLLQNPKTRAQFNKSEIQAIEAVANGTPASNFTRLLGQLGFDFGSGRNFLGGAIGLGAGQTVGGPLGALAVGAVGAGARKLGQAMTRGAAERAGKVVATPNIPQVSLPRLPAPPMGALALPAIDQIREMMKGAKPATQGR